MNNIIKAQRDTKSHIRTITLIFAIGLAFFAPMLNAYAVPQDSNFGGGQCKDSPEALSVTCCWYESDEEGIEIRYCQHCDIDLNTGDVTNNCGEKHPVGLMPSTSNGNVGPNDGEIIDDTQQPNYNSPLTDQRVQPGNLGVLEQSEESSNNQNSESEDSVSSANPGLFNVVPQNPTNLEQP
jgi:hypothetical protein